MITKEQHSKLQDTAQQYQHGSYEIPQVESTMEQVFGDNRTGEDATEWARYWTTLITYCEQRDDGDSSSEEPPVC